MKFSANSTGKGGRRSQSAKQVPLLRYLVSSIFGIYFTLVVAYNKNHGVNLPITNNVDFIRFRNRLAVLPNCLHAKL